MTEFATLAEPPYYAVIFAAVRRERSDDGYDEMADAMSKLASEQPGYIGHDATRGPDGFGITVSYWRDEDSLLDWKKVARHALAQKLGAERWYSHYTLRVAKVERSYEGPAGRTFS